MEKELNKQTAVDWLIEQLQKTRNYQKVINEANENKSYVRNVIKQAKEMEKEQHADTWDKSMDNLDVRGGNIVRAWEDFDEHYEQTYGCKDGE